MEISLIGYVTILLGLFFFIKSPRLLYGLTIFFVPFTGSAAFQISLSSVQAQGIRVSMVLGVLSFLRYLISLVAKEKIRVPFGQRAPLIILLLWGGVVCSSLIMPFLISGKLKVLDTYASLVYYATEEPLFFKFQYVTQTLYFLFGIFFAAFVALKNPDSKTLRQTLKVYLYASLFVAIWGFVEIILFYLHVPYPWFLFNHNSMNMDGTLEIGGIPRVSSVALEPSILAQQLLTTLPFLFWGIYYKVGFISVGKQKIILGLVVLILMLCYSSTAYVGLVILGGLITLKLMARRRIPRIFLVLTGIIALSILAATPFLIDDLIQKLNDYSGLERMRAIVYGWKYFHEYPLLGIGWGAMPTWDLIICVLVGAGIIGLGGLIWLLTLIFANYKRQLNLDVDDPERQREFWFIRVSTLQSLVILLAVSQLSGFIYHSQYFWLILGLAIAGSSIRKETTPQP